MQWTRELRRNVRRSRTLMRLVSAAALAPSQPRGEAAPQGVFEIADFGANPGGLRMFAYAPAALPQGAPLVALLHGCGQHAAAFARDTGWIETADRLGFALVMAEQVQANNAGRCLNWFRPASTHRDQGEAASIRAMAAEGLARFGADPARVFVAGLSAGGAMAAAMLAAYPDVFAAGASIAGLPVGVANGTAQALSRMAKAGPRQSPELLAAAARAFGPPGYAGPLPRLSIWHGERDHTVDPGNAIMLAEQWAALHAMAEAPAASLPSPQVARRVWGRPDFPAMELCLVEAIAHGYPIDGTAGHAADFILPARVSATTQIARFWNLDGAARQRRVA